MSMLAEGRGYWISFIEEEHLSSQQCQKYIECGLNMQYLNTIMYLNMIYFAHSVII